jgi:DNA-directed RNA polymerase specialized sigma24 family protein
MSASTLQSLVAFLVELTLDGDAWAVRAVLAEVQERLGACIRNGLGQDGCNDPDQAKEIAQDIWEKLFEALAWLRAAAETLSQGKLAGSLAKIAEKALGSHRRGEMRRHRREQKAAGPEVWFDEKDEKEDARWELLTPVLDELTPAEREYLRECRGELPCKKRSKDAVRQLVCRLRQHLRALGVLPPNRP